MAETVAKTKKPTLQEYVAYGISALQQRKNYLVNIMNSTTNPLEKLACKDKIEEIDISIKYFNDYEGE